jgi:flagellar basal body-associated protein FliL
MIERRRNWAPWVGLLLALAAVLANAGFFLRVPGEKAIPWISLALAIVALLCAVVGITRAFRQPQVYGGKVASSILGVVSLAICGLTVFMHVHARDLPASTAAPQVGQKAPEFALADTNGTKVSLERLLGKAEASAPVLSTNAGGSSPASAASNATAEAPKAVLLVFYRGYW